MRIENPRAVAAISIVAAAAFGGRTIINNMNAPDRVATNGEHAALHVKQELRVGENIPVVAAIIAVDGGVNYRTTPVKLTTDNAQLLQGNTISDRPGFENSILNGPTILVRPAIAINKKRLSSEDPQYWLTGLQNDHEVFLGINKDTLSHMTAYQLPEANGELPDFTDDVTVTGINTQNGIIFQSSGYIASAGLIRESTGSDDPYLQNLKAKGYRQVDIPLSQIAKAVQK